MHWPAGLDQKCDGGAGETTGTALRTGERGMGGWAGGRDGVRLASV